MTASLDGVLGARAGLTEALAAAGEAGVPAANRRPAEPETLRPGPQAGREAALVAALRAALVTALHAVDAVVVDDALWQGLGDTAADLRPTDLPRLAALVGHRLAPLLTAFGHEAPPPVQELVDTTAALLGAAVAAVGDPDRAEDDVDLARCALRAFVARARARTATAVPPDVRELRSWGRRTLRMLDRLVPPVAGAGAAALVDAALGGGRDGGQAGAVNRPVDELVAQLVELAAGYLVGWGEEVLAATPVPSLPPGGLRMAELELLAEAFGTDVAGWAAGRGSAGPLPPALRAELDEIDAALAGFAEAVGDGMPGLDGRTAGVRDALRELRRHAGPAPAVPAPPGPPAPRSPSGPASSDGVARATAALLVRVRDLRAGFDAASG